jgi:HTH-type transcriptional regulator/antitoxin HigA
MAVMASQRPFRPTYVVPPGATIADLIEEHAMTQTELAKRLGVTLKHVNQVVNGGASISAELALGLEKVFEVPASFWLSRESLYQADLARQSETQELESHIAWASQFPVRELKKRRYLPADAHGVELVQALLGFLGVASPRLWHDPAVAYRKSRSYESDPFALAAWLRVGERDGAEIDCEPYDRDRFISTLHEARRMTRRDPKEWQPQLTELLARAGVALVIADTFKGARANGATRWLTPSKALLQLSLRYRWEDIFWFSFFHEAGHIALHRKKGVFVDGLAVADRSQDSEAERLEREADRFAARILIPERYEARLRQLRAAEIQAFADELEITPAIVVGRLQHEGLMHFSESVKYKRRLRFVEDAEAARARR